MIKNNYKNFLAGIVCLFSFILLVFCPVYSFAENEPQQMESKIICRVNVNDDFDLDSIIVILNRQATFSCKDYSVNDFPEVNCIKVEDLTYNTSKLVKRQQNGSISNDEMSINFDKFRKILKLYINLNDSENTENLNILKKENIINCITKLSNRIDILYVGPNYECEQDINVDLDVNKNRALYDQWDKNLIDLFQARTINTGSNNVLVGVIDTGIDGTHSNLMPNVENNLHRDFRYAKITNVDIPFDTAEHGTHVAGIIGAKANAYGVCGVCDNVNLVSLLISEGSSWYVDNAVLAIDYATANNIMVLNYSGRVRNRGGSVNIDDPVLKQAIKSYPGILIAAAGNDGANNDLNPYYPANYSVELDNVISVGAIDENKEITTFSNYGKISVNIYAPGKNIISTIPSNRYIAMNGTSMAAPFVTGVAALMLSEDSTLTASEIKNIILNSADTITITLPDGTKQEVKKLNAFNALNEIQFETNNLGSDAIEITSFKNEELTNVIVPKKLRGRTVTAIGSNAFLNKNQITKIKLPETITNIKSGAFRGCSALKEINIPTAVTNIGENAFAYTTNLKSINFGLNSQLKTIKLSAFYGSGIESINLPNGLKNIDRSAFIFTKLKSLKIPDTVETIGFMAFAHITNLTTVEFGENSKLTFIANNVFYYSGVESITFPSGLDFIGQDSFYGTNLKNINIPETVEEIDGTAFANTVNLTSVTFGENSQLKKIGERAFFGSGITQIDLPKSIVTIGMDAFVNCKNLTAINVTLGNTKYMTPGGVLYSYDYSELICFPAGKAFLPGVYLQTTKIGQYAFAYNDYLTEITLPNKVSTVGTFAFYFSDSLTDIYVKNTSKIMNLEVNAFSGMVEEVKIYVPDSLYSQYVAKYPNYNFVKSSAKAVSESIVAAGESASDETVPLGEPFILPDDRREYYSL